MWFVVRDVKQIKLTFLLLSFSGNTKQTEGDRCVNCPRRSSRKKKAQLHQDVFQVFIWKYFNIKKHLTMDKKDTSF